MKSSSRGWAFWTWRVSSLHHRENMNFRFITRRPSGHHLVNEWGHSYQHILCKIWFLDGLLCLLHTQDIRNDKNIVEKQLLVTASVHLQSRSPCCIKRLGRILRDECVKGIVDKQAAQRGHFTPRIKTFQLDNKQGRPYLRYLPLLSVSDSPCKQIH